MAARGTMMLTGFLLFCGIVKVTTEKICQGTDTGFSFSGPALDRYLDAKSRYTNCTFVDGNLEIKVLDEAPNYDLSFLKNIREVTGYVLINQVHASVIPLTELRIIRGKSKLLYNYREHSLYVAMNYDIKREDVGLTQLAMTSLHEISTGDVFIVNNRDLCFTDTIRWDDIVRGANALHNLSANNNNCVDCDGSCYEVSDKRTHCWGPGEENCQELNHTTCAPQCDAYCYGRQPSECCHSECAAGCTGPGSKDCWACTHFQAAEEDGGGCVTACPPMHIYDPISYKDVINPVVRYVFDTRCVMECPSHMLVNRRSCVKSCDEDQQVIDGECQTCDGPCPKRCPGTGRSGRSGNLNGHHNHSSSIRHFEGCTTVEGNLRILDASFEGHSYDSLPGINMSDLALLKDIQEITGFLMVETEHLSNLSFLSNLQVIRGMDTMPNGVSLRITYNSNLMMLGLVSLKEVSHGHIVISGNDNLCYVSSVNFSALQPAEGGGQYMIENKDESVCETEGAVCDEQCSELGCWGPGPRQCISCAHFSFEGECVSSCKDVIMRFDAGNATCKRCDPQCNTSCTGPGADDCHGCKHVKDGPFCRAECPIGKYVDNSDQTCRPCNDSCLDNCTGPANTLGEGGCDICAKALYSDRRGTIEYCLPEESECGENYHKGVQYVNNVKTELPACHPCHAECKGCDGPANYMGHLGCKNCTNMLEGGTCIASCGQDAYTEGFECLQCSSTCSGCYGPSSTQCLKCRDMTIIIMEPGEPPEVEIRNCTETCPEDHPYTDSRTEDGQLVKLCVTYNPDKTKHMIIGLVLGAVFILAIALVIFIYCWRQRTRAQENVVRLTAKITGVEEMEPLNQTDASPDMSNLRLIKEFELRKGKTIGSGAFGTVFSGVWVPEGEQVKIPVAIKQMREATAPGETKELLAEARVMASVRHPCCVRIIALCLTDPPMLITQLMPMGCLLDYIRQHRMHIGSKVFLNWCTQIAKGMAYLEAKGIVHRDLAARNVLVQSPNQVKITDFGLSKLLNIHQEEYHANGGKMPLKWLALESIRYQVYTSKSDVWSYGVTMWEMFTYGGRPYENISARDVLRLLEKGERLPQPSICTIDLYMVMINCWLVDAESRPSFRELVHEVAKMASDPGRYLVIQGDELLKLPSQDRTSHDMLRQMSVVAKQPGKLIDVDDYLQPQSLYTPTPPMSPSWNDPEQSMFFPSKGAECKPERLTSTSGEGFPMAPSIKKQCSIPRQDSTEGRYTDDPCGARSASSSPAEDYLPPVASANVSKSPLGDEYMDPVLRPQPPKLPPPSDYLEPIRESVGETPMEGYLDMGGSVCSSPPTAVQNPLYGRSAKPTSGGEYMNHLSVSSDDSDQNYMNQQRMSGDTDDNYVNQLDSPGRSGRGMDDEYDHLLRTPGVRDSYV